MQVRHCCRNCSSKNGHALHRIAKHPKQTTEFSCFYFDDKLSLRLKNRDVNIIISSR